MKYIPTKGNEKYRGQGMKYPPRGMKKAKGKEWNTPQGNEKYRGQGMKYIPTKGNEKYRGQGMKKAKGKEWNAPPKEQWNA